MTDEQPVGLAARIRWRLTLPTVLFVFLSSLDRVNVSFAALHMNADLGFSPAQYGFGASILFAGYLLGQFPSMLLLQHLGFPKWLALLATTWGVAATAMAFIHGASEFYVLRVVLGVAEGGLAPGIVLYLSRFATEGERASTFALPVLAIPLSIILGGPISGWLLDMTTPLGLSSWRWMFLAQGLPTVLLGIASYFYFPREVADASWLRPDERRWLTAHVRHQASATDEGRNDWTVVRDGDIWLIAGLWFCLLSSSYAIMFWLPQVVGQFGHLSALEIGLVNALPWIANIIAMYLNAGHSDRAGERIWHIAVPALLGAAALAAAASTAGPVALILMCVVGLCLGAAQGPFWALPTTMLSKRSFAVGIVLINVIGSTGGMIVPFSVGVIRQSTGSFAAPVFALAFILLAAAILVMSARRRVARRTPNNDAAPPLRHPVQEVAS